MPKRTDQKRRNVGAMGEKQLALWAAQVDMTINPVEQDETGWDFLLEIAADSDSEEADSLPLDLVPGSFRCMVQVKSSDKKRGSWHIKLSNLERFVKNPLPCFILVLEFDKTNDCQTAYLVHIWEEEIRLVLRKLRELTPEKDADLHKYTLPIPYRSKKQLASLDGDGLLRAIREYIRTSPEEYTTRKHSLVQQVGYEQGSRLVEFSIRVPDGSMRTIDELLVDFAIGVETHLHVVYGEIFDIRFGIRAPKPLHILENEMLEMERSPIGKATISLSLPTQRKDLTLETDLYIPQGLSIDQDPHLVKFRLATTGLDFILTPTDSKKCQLKYVIPELAESVRLSDIKPVADLIDFMDKIPIKECAHFDIVFQDKLFAEGTLCREASLNKRYVEYATSVINTWRVLQFFDIPEDMSVIPGYLVQQTGVLQLMDSLLSGNIISIKVEFIPELPLSDVFSEKVHSNGLFCCPIVRSVTLGEYRIGISLVAIGSLTPLENNDDDVPRMQMITQDVRLHKKYIWKSVQEDVFTEEELITLAIQPFQEEMFILRV